jgi:hypothetical protein
MSDDRRDVVVDEPANNRFVVEQAGGLAELVYRRDGDRLVLVHTGVPEKDRHRGVAGLLVQAAVERAVKEHLTLVPSCSYARKWLQDHPELETSVTIEWPPS